MRSKSILWSFNYAIDGIVYALRTQRNMRLHVAAAIVVLVAALFFRIDGVELIALVFAICFVLAAELINTAVEAAIDVATDRFDPVAKIAKDVAAGAVLIASVNAIAVGYLVFFSHLTAVTETVLTRVRGVPDHITVIALGLTALGVLVAKALTKEGTFMRGGWPSGHTALAVSAATAVSYITQSPQATVGSGFIAALVAQSRVETDAHTVPQVLLGAVGGFLITTIVFQVFWW